MSVRIIFLGWSNISNIFYNEMRDLVRRIIFERCWSLLEEGQIEEARFEAYLLLTRDLLIPTHQAKKLVCESISDRKIKFRFIDSII